MPLLFNIVLELLATAIRRKTIQIAKEVVKLSLFADEMRLYIENPEDAIRKLLDLINEFSKGAGYKINTQKSLAFLYTNNEKSQREMKETPCTTPLRRIKYTWQGICVGPNLPPLPPLCPHLHSLNLRLYSCPWASLVAHLVKNLPAMWETPGLGRSPGEGKGSPL